MKQKLNITIDEEKIKLLEELTKDSRFRSKSHIIEHSLEILLKSLIHPTSKEVGVLNKFLDEEENGK